MCFFSIHVVKSVRNNLVKLCGSSKLSCIKVKNFIKHLLNVSREKARFLTFPMIEEVNTERSCY